MIYVPESMRSLQSNLSGFNQSVVQQTRSQAKTEMSQMEDEMKRQIQLLALAR